MAIEFTPQSVTTGTGSTTLINNNFNNLDIALQNALSRDGTAPNAMLANLDMNSKRILNLPAATSNTEPVTYAQFVAAQGDLLYTGEIDGANVIFTPAGTGSVESNVQAELVILPKTPQQFGAVGDNTTDDTAAFQAAIDACIAAGGKKLYIPAGTYKITSTLVIETPDPGGFIIEGDAPSKTKINYSGAGYCIDLGTVLGSNQTDCWAVTIKDIGFYGTANPKGAIRFAGAYFCRIENCHILDFTRATARGIYLMGDDVTLQIPNYHNVIEKCYIRNVPTGIHMNGGTGIGANSNFIRNCWFGVHSTYAINIDAGDANVVEQCEFNGSTTNAINITGDADLNKIMFNQFDGPTTQVTIGSSASATLLLGNTGAGSISDSGSGTFVLDAYQNLFYNRQGMVIGGANNPTNIVPLTVRTPAGHTTDYFRVEDSSSAFKLKVVGNHTEVAGSFSTHGIATFKNDVVGNSIVVKIDTDTTPGAVGLQVIADSLQSADIMQVKTEGGTELLNITSAGNLEITKPQFYTAAASTLTVSSNTITPTAPAHFVGAGLIKTITVPSGMAGGRITLIPTAAFTTDTTANIAIASTATIGRAMDFTYDSVTTKWYPSY